MGNKSRNHSDLSTQFRAKDSKMAFSAFKSKHKRSSLKQDKEKQVCEALTCTLFLASALLAIFHYNETSSTTCPFT